MQYFTERGLIEWLVSKKFYGVLESSRNKYFSKTFLLDRKDHPLFIPDQPYECIVLQSNRCREYSFSMDIL